MISTSTNNTYEGKRILVTGAAGFLGTHIIQELLKQNAFIKATMHKKQLHLPSHGIEIVQTDLSIKSNCLDIMQNVDYVFHCAGAVGSAAVSAADSMSGISTNLTLTSQVLHAAWKNNVKKVLLVSSSTVYPPADYAITEDEAWNGPTYDSYLGYGWMKRYLEKLAEFVHNRSDTKIALVRPTAVYGRWDNFDPTSGHVIPSLIQRALRKENPFEVWGDGTEVRDFLHISDLARGCLLALDKYAMCDPVNLGYGSSVTVTDVVNLVLKYTDHTDARIIYNTSKPTTAPIRMVNIEKAKSILDFEPIISLDAGIQDTIEWYQLVN